MKKFLRTALMLVMAISLMPTQAGAVETVETLSIDDKSNKSASFTSDPIAGIAPSFFLGGTAGNDYECGDFGPNCEYFLVEVTGLTDEEIAAAEAAGETITDRVNVNVGIRDDAMAGDIDIIIYASDADATKGAELGRKGDLDTELNDEDFPTSFTATMDEPTGYFLVEVVFFAGAGTYEGYATAF